MEYVSPVKAYARAGHNGCNKRNNKPEHRAARARTLLEAAPAVVQDGSIRKWARGIKVREGYRRFALDDKIYFGA